MVVSRLNNKEMKMDYICFLFIRLRQIKKIIDGKRKAVFENLIVN